MSSNQKNPLQEYVSGAKKLQSDARFRQDMLDRIAEHSHNTVSGVERITRRPSMLPKRIGVIAAMLCCAIGIAVFATNSFRDTFDPHHAGNSSTDSYVQDSVGGWESQGSAPDFDVSDAVVRQLAMVEKEITAYEEQAATEGLKDHDRDALGQLESQKKHLLQELCRGGRFMIAYADYCYGYSRIRLTVVNGTNWEITLPEYYRIVTADSNYTQCGGRLTVDNQWDLHTLPPHSWMTVYCELRTAGHWEIRYGSETGGGRWAYEQTWELPPDDYTVFLTKELSEQASPVYQADFYIDRTVKIAGLPSDPVSITTDEIFDDSIPHIPMEDLADLAEGYRSSGYTKEAACRKLLEAVMTYSGRPDFGASGVKYDIYCIGEDANAMILCKDGKYSYHYTDTENGISHTAALWYIGTFGELN
ncbi:MAG: hypothetical protein IJC75_05110 [Oscillospiraceae bacterium]|nr:hypothetical protein [Oscillospiraceae bacterium]